MARDDVLFLASGMAFNVIACLLPILVFLVYVLGVWFRSAEAIRCVDRLMESAFPDQPQSMVIRQNVTFLLSQVVANRASFGVLSLAVLLGTAATLFSSLRSVLHCVYEVKHRRHFVLSYMVDLCLVLGVTLMILLNASLSWLYHMVKHLIRQFPVLADLGLPGLYAVIPHLLSPLLLFVLCCLLYRYVPARRIHWETALVSGATTSLIWQFSSYVFAWYLGRIATFNHVYGTYAFVVVMLIWIYYSSVIFVFGAEVGWVRQQRHHAAAMKNEKIDG